MAMLLRACATPIAHGMGSYKKSHILNAVQDFRWADQAAGARSSQAQPKPGKG